MRWTRRASCCRQWGIQPMLSISTRSTEESSSGWPAKANGCGCWTAASARSTPTTWWLPTTRRRWSLVVRWTSLLFVPDIFGGNGSGGQPNYFAHYNLPEVTGYVGVLALIATFAFIAKLTRRGWRGEDRDFILYFVGLVVGLFATWGSY